MLLLSNSEIEKYEKEEKYIQCVKYLYPYWESNKNDTKLFLRISVEIWYALAFDGCDLNLAEEERKYLYEKLINLLKYFLHNLEGKDDDYWIFGYIMIIRPDLFICNMLEYDEVEKTGFRIIEDLKNKKNIYATYIYSNITNSCQANNQNEILKSIQNDFNEKCATDEYFIEIFTNINRNI